MRLFHNRADASTLPVHYVWKNSNSCIWLEERIRALYTEDICEEAGGHVFILNDTDTEMTAMGILGELNGTSVYIVKSDWPLPDNNYTADKSLSTKYGCVKLLNGELLEASCSTEQSVTLCESYDLWRCEQIDTSSTFGEQISETITMPTDIVHRRTTSNVSRYERTSASSSPVTSPMTSPRTSPIASSVTSPIRSLSILKTDQISSVSPQLRHPNLGSSVLSDTLLVNDFSVNDDNSSDTIGDDNSTFTSPELLISLNSSQVLTTSTQKSSVVTPCEMLQIPSNHGMRNVTFCNFLHEIMEKSNISDVYETTVTPEPSHNITTATPDTRNSSTLNNQTSHYHGPPVTDVKFQVSGMNNGSVRPWMGGKLPSQPVVAQVPTMKSHNISNELNDFKNLDNVDNTTLKEFSDTVIFAGEDKHISEETEDVKTSILENIIDVGEHLIGKIPVSMKSVVMETAGIGVISNVIVYDEINDEDTFAIRSQHDENYIQLSKKILDSQDRTSNISETAEIKDEDAIFFEFETYIDRSKHENTRLCTFWDFHERIWSTYGCKVIAKNSTHTSCQCNHLTSFAILVLYMDATEIRKKFYEKRRKWSTTRTASDPDMTFPSRRKTGSFDAIRAAAAATQLQAEYGEFHCLFT
ncbi:hypothetical protein ACF0H5_020601 [Mactra antiquata]